MEKRLVQAYFYALSASSRRDLAAHLEGCTMHMGQIWVDVPRASRTDTQDDILLFC